MCLDWLNDRYATARQTKHITLTITSINNNIIKKFVRREGDSPGLSGTLRYIVTYKRR